MDREILSSLALKYSGQIPRYTSYPTAVEFQETFQSQDWSKALAVQGLSYSFYVHIPFCQSLCYFCACNKVIPQRRDVVAPYLEALQTELKLYRDLLGAEIPVEQLHWGGGTPNYLLPEEMEELAECFFTLFPGVKPDADISIEIDPRTVTEDQFKVLQRTGFNRVSFGVQDFQQQVQVAINRVQSFQQTQEVCAMSQAVGIDAINIDLIYGLPNQTEQSFSETIDQVLALRPSRIAVYGYAHVTWLRKVQRTLERSLLPTPAQRVQLFVTALNKLCRAGYCYVGMDHFALPEDELFQAKSRGTLNRNFMGYSTHREAYLIGIGASSISSTHVCYAQNERQIESYQKQMLRGCFPICRGFRKSFDDCLRSEIIEQLLCLSEISIAGIENKWNVNFWSYFAAEALLLEPFIADGLIHLSPRHIELTSIGELFSRNVASVFDSYLAGRSAQSIPVFSQAV